MGPLVVTKRCEAPHDVVFEQITSRAALQLAARCLLGTGGIAVEPAGDVLPGRYAVSQAFSLRPAGPEQQLRPAPLGFAAVAGGGRVDVTVQAQLPSSVAMHLTLGNGEALALEAHVRPTAFHSADLTLALHLSGGRWPGSRLHFR